MNIYNYLIQLEILKLYKLTSVEKHRLLNLTEEFIYYYYLNYFIITSTIFIAINLNFNCLFFDKYFELVS